MNKPITLMKNEYIENLVKVTNASPLPAFLKIYILRDIISELNTLAQQQEQSDCAAYDKACAEEVAKTETTSEDDK